MAEQRWERLGAATGIVFVILGVVAYFVAGEPPKADDSVGQLVSYYTENRDSVMLSGYLWGVAGIFFLWFLGSLRAHLRVAEGEAGRLSAVVFGSGLLLGAFFIAGIVSQSALVFGLPQGFAGAREPVTAAFFTLASQAFAFTSFFVVVFAGATSLVSGRTKVFPAWLGWIGWLVALSGAVGSVAVFATSGAFATGGAYTNIGFGLFFLWFLALAITLTQQVGRGSAVQR